MLPQLLILKFYYSVKVFIVKTGGLKGDPLSTVIIK